MWMENPRARQKQNGISWSTCLLRALHFELILLKSRVSVVISLLATNNMNNIPLSGWKMGQKCNWNTNPTCAICWPLSNVTNDKQRAQLTSKDKFDRADSICCLNTSNWLQIVPLQSDNVHATSNKNGRLSPLNCTLYLHLKTNSLAETRDELNTLLHRYINELK